jgi:hypothetical protein
MAKRIRKRPPLEAVAPESAEAPELARSLAEREEITQLAHQFWIERGCPLGTPEADWSRAEEEIRSRAGKRRRAARGM